MKKKKAPALCPCGSSLSYEDCCGRFHEGELPPTALALMKSRYSAFVKGDSQYLLKTWHSSTRPAELQLDDPIKWLGLEIKDWEEAGDAATVTFVARGKLQGRAFRQEEKSRFVRENGFWFYVDGDVE